ncbi:MAG: two-component regulator propeller domain-containing protein [Candidatus Cyclobacteriaceae bacterium M3_2C_046]
MKLRLLFGVAFWIFITRFSFSQHFVFKNYAVEDGIAQSNANDIIQDVDGYIWFATQKGVCRFDGQQFTTLSEKEGLISNIVLSLFQDSQGNMWFGTRFGLSKMENNQFTNFDQESGLPHTLVYHINEDQQGNIWLATRNGPCYYDKDGWHSIDLNLRTNVIFIDENNDVWLGTSKGLYIYHENGFLEKFNLLEDKFVTDIIKDSQGKMWFSTSKGAFSYFNEQIFSFYVENGLPADNIEDMLLDSKGNIWFATDGKGISKFNGLDFQHYNQQNGLFNTSVFVLYEDMESNIWIGGRNGVTIFNQRIPFVHYQIDENLKEGDFFGMLEDKNGNYWFTTYGDGILKYDGHTFTHFTEDTGLPDNRFFSALEDHEGNLWFSSAGSGVIKYDGTRFEKYGYEKGFGNYRVFKIIQDRYQNFWMATQGNGVLRYDGHEFQKINPENQIPNDVIIDVYEDSKGYIWLASVGNGVYKLQNQADSIQGPVVNFNKELGLKSSFVRCITEDKNGNIWLGSASNGVIKVIEEKDTVNFSYLGEKDGLKSDNIYQLKFDRNNNLWVGSEKGLDRLIIDQENNLISVKNYQRQQGFVGVETTLNGVLEDSRGNLWFGTVSGITKYMPDYDVTNKVTPKTHIKGIKLFYQDEDLSPYCDSLNEKSMPVNFDLPYYKDHITFEFIGISLSNPDEVRYQFMLEGLDKSWSPVNAKNEAVYTNVPPGKYTFKVKACNDDGIWNEEPVVLSFMISPPVWKEPWFIIIGVVGFVSAGFGAVKWRFHELKEAKTRLEFKVEQRTAEITQQKEEISRQKEAIEIIKEEIEQKNRALELQNIEIASQRDILKIQKTEIENKNLDITASIAYAKRIQHSMLPQFKRIRSEFQELFILFKPKAIVSGDFYWFSKKDDKLIVAAIDCTGHGVPGAFMAMVGDSLLSQIINMGNVLEPDEVLNRLHVGVQNVLNQDNNGNTDGMDIALVVIDKKERTVKYAGAKNPLVYIQDDNLHFIKGDRQPIGANLNGKRHAYGKHQISLAPDSTFYIFTDGYQDQFGGKDDKKFMIKRFKNLLFDIHKLPLDQQKHKLDQTIEDWKDGREQIDDVLVIGFKIP